MRCTVLLVLLIALVGLPACGGGGGGGGSGGSAFPGTLIALAVEGTPTPAGAPTAGSFAPINLANPIMDAGAGSWAAFVATVNLSGGGSRDVLYVAEPGGTLHEVYAVGDPEPAGGGATITGFARVWMCGDGTVYAYASMSPNPLFGVISARVLNGAVQNRQKVVYRNDLLPGDGVNGLGTFDVPTARIDGTCTLWFLGTLVNTGARALYSIETNGSGAARHVVTGQPVAPAAMVAGIDAIAVSEDGGYFGCVLNVGGGTQNVYSSATGTGVIRLVAQTGGAVPDLVGTFADAYKDGQPIYVSSSGQVVFVGIGSTAATDDVLVIMDPDHVIDRVLARTGGAPNATLPDEYVAITLLSQRLEAGSFPQFSATLTGGPLSIASYAYDIGRDVANRYVYDGRPYLGGGEFTGLLPGLVGGTNRLGNRDISFAFRDQLSFGATGVFWAFPTQAPLAVALQGGNAPGGDTYGAFVATAHTTENGVLLFTANLTNAGTGLFRQG